MGRGQAVACSPCKGDGGVACCLLVIPTGIGKTERLKASTASAGPALSGTGLCGVEPVVWAGSCWREHQLVLKAMKLMKFGVSMPVPFLLRCSPSCLNKSHLVQKELKLLIKPRPVAVVKCSIHRWRLKRRLNAQSSLSERGGTR